MVSFPINIPTNVNIKSFKMDMAHAVVSRASPFSGHQQVQSFMGEWWECKVTMPLMNREEAEEWVGFLGLLRGPTNTFLMGDPDAVTPRGVAAGTPLVDGANQTGTSLNIKGFTAGVTGILKAGDYIQIENNLYKVLQDVNSDGTGDATVDLFPRIRLAHPDSDPITVTNAKGIWRLKPGKVGWTTDSSGLVSLSFDCLEAF